MNENSLLPRDANAIEADAALPPDRNPALVYLARLGSPNSRRAMAGALKNLARVLTPNAEDTDPRTLPWWLLRYQHTTAARTILAERYSASTTNLALAALRGVLKECWRLGLMPAEEYQRACDLAPVKESRLPAGREVSREEVARMFDGCDVTPSGRRNAALLALLYGCGLRRHEVARLDREDLDLEAGALRVRGKGRKERLGHLPDGAKAAVAAWLAVRGEEPGPLLYPVAKGGKVEPRRLTTQAVYLALDRIRKRAGVASMTPHDLRRSFIGSLLDAGADLASVQALAGHASPTTTARYDRRGERARARAARLHSVPYAG